MQSYAIQIGHDGLVTAAQSSDFNFGTGDFTVEAWVKTLKGGTVVGHKGSAAGSGNGGFWLVIQADGTIKFRTEDGFGYCEVVGPQVSINDGVWHHLAAVRQGTLTPWQRQLSIYLDGKPLTVAAHGNSNSPPPLNVNNSQRLTIGNLDYESQENRHFMGMIAEVRLWNMARSAGDIKRWLSEKLPADVPGLVGYWAADFGMTLDFSSRRHATTTSGTVSETTGGPPVLAKSEIPSLFLFKGPYATGVKSGSQWQDAGPLYITGAGIVIYKGTRINSVKFSGNTLSWPANGNPSAASFTFKLDSSNSNFWPDGPRNRPLFEGHLQTPGQAQVDFRGLIQPQPQLCGAILSTGDYQSGTAGRTWYAQGGGMPGSSVGLTKQTQGQHEHFCVYDDDMLLYMRTGAAVSVNGSIQDGASLILKERATAGADARWLFMADGTVRPKSNQRLAVTAVPHDGNPRLVLADARGIPGQRWLSLSLKQFVWNGIPDRVLTADFPYPSNVAPSGGYNYLGGGKKANNSPQQLWYFVRDAIITDGNGSALTATGTVGATVNTGTYSSISPAQRFISNGTQIVHVPTGLILKLNSQMMAHLAAADDTSDAAKWTISPYREVATASEVHPEMETTRQEVATDVGADIINYVVEISTANAPFAGTDDSVEIALVGDSKTTRLFTLIDSKTHYNPFERGQTDRFIVPLPNVGHLRGIFFRYGQNTWTGGERWMVSAVSVYDPTTITTYEDSYVSEDGARFFMPYQTMIYFKQERIESGDSTMSVGKAPTQDRVTKGWVDHTWVKVSDTNRRTYFDCAGGHEGPDTTNDIVTMRCSLNQAVKMATGFSIGPSHPWKEVYGHNDVDGKETCGVRASGFRNWDGQCHQMVNRLLYMGFPRRTLADAGDKRPTGYGLTCLLWGPYGVGFADWCRQAGIYPPDPTGDAIFDYIQRYCGNQKQSHQVMYHAINMQEALKTDPENPQGTHVKEFFKKIHNDNISNSTIGKLVCLPEDKVQQEEQ
jgi:Concanavalin A-like lectin/glucanases superfamily/PLAT/LH2 domain/OAA-family lectin sugar binding domain